MKQYPKISIITINFNKGRYLENTILSILNQSYKKFEFIVIDKESSDNSIKIIEKYQDKIDLIVSESDKGIYHEMNRGIDKAKGEYLLFLNGGDLLLSRDILSECESFLDKNFDIVYGDVHRRFPNITEDILKGPSELSFYTFYSGSIPQSSTFIKRDLFNKYGNYREDLKIVSDWAFFLKIFSFYNISSKYIDFAVTSLFVDGISFQNNIKLHDERLIVLSDLYSKDLISIFDRYNIYRKTYFKKSSRIIRYISRKTSSISSFKNCRDSIYENKRVNIIRLINSTVCKQTKDPLSIPVIIINYNRLSYIKSIVSQLLNLKHKNIVIIDNNSTYPPLLEYYESIKDIVTIERMPTNYGHLVFWDRKDLLDKYGKGYYVVTDSDIQLNEKLPLDYITCMKRILDKNKNITKVGFALDISDIPDHYSLKDDVIDWESKYWDNKIEKGLYLADVDTTFALYRPLYKFKMSDFTKGIRIAGDYTAKHLPWYINNKYLTDEDIFYIKTANSSNSWKLDCDNNEV